jgi:hypothetical protein
MSLVRHLACLASWREQVPVLGSPKFAQAAKTFTRQSSQRGDDLVYSTLNPQLQMYSHSAPRVV